MSSSLAGLEHGASLFFSFSFFHSLPSFLLFLSFWSLQARTKRTRALLSKLNRKPVQSSKPSSSYTVTIACTSNHGSQCQKLFTLSDSCLMTSAFAVIQGNPAMFSYKQLHLTFQPCQNLLWYRFNILLQKLRHYHMWEARVRYSIKGGGGGGRGNSAQKGCLFIPVICEWVQKFLTL